MTDKEKKKCKYMISILGEQILDDEFIIQSNNRFVKGFDLQDAHYCVII